jgi:hypothetical protein
MKQAIAALVVLIGLALALNAGFIQRLRTAHSARWQDLGGPSPLFGPTSRASLARTAFLWGADYRELGDPVLNRWAAAVRISEVAYLAGFAWVLLRRMLVE